MAQNIDKLIEKIQKLDINQKRVICELVDELVDENRRGSTSSTTRGTVVTPNVNVRTQPRRPNHNFISGNGVPLSVGDHVEILTTRKVGRAGDIRQVDKFNKKYVAVTILASGRSTQRDSKYLDFIE